MIKIYEIKGVVECSRVFRIGALTVRCNFSGGAVNESGMVPAIYSTKNPITQVMIENSDSFKSGRIRLQSVIQEESDKEEKQEDYMGIGDKGILSVGTDMEKTVLEMIGEMIDEDSAILSIYYGEEMNEDSANEIAEKVEEEYPDVEVEVHYGGQPIYYYVISVE